MPITEGGRFSPTQNIVSPGVFTREIDQSGLAQGIANIGAAIVAPFADGPAFFPNIITEISTLESRYGIADGVYYGPYTAKEYLKEQGIVTIVRVGGLTGYWQKNPLIVYAQPGVWNRADDAGAMTTDSYVYLDDTSYTTNIQLQLSSSDFYITGAANIPDRIGTTKFITGDDFERVTNAEINSFLGGISSLPNNVALSASMATSASLGKLFKATLLKNYAHFSASVAAQGKTLAKLGSSVGYALAAFDFEKSNMSGSIGITHPLGPASGAFKLNFNTAFIPQPYYNYLTNSFASNQYGFVFAEYPTNQTRNFATASIVTSSVQYTARYDTSRLVVSGAMNATFGSIAATSNTLADATDGVGTLSGSVLYAGQTLDAGDISTGILIRKGIGLTLAAGQGYFLLTSSVQGQSVSAETMISTAFAESTTTVPFLSSSYIKNITFVPSENIISSTNSLTLVSGSFASLRGVGTCTAALELKGAISGAFGKYNGTFSAADNNNALDQCNPTLTGRQKMILAVLANTQNGSTQFSNDYEVYGFNTTTLSQLTSSVFPYKTLVNPTENIYNLALKYNFVNADGSTSSGTYGYYDFSLNESDNNYIKDVFGVEPTVGNPAKQISGQKVEAAYNYVIFEDSIKKFVAEKTDAMGWKLQVGTSALSGSSIIGEPLKFVDRYSTNPNAGDSQFAITNAFTPWVYSQKIAPFKGSADASPSPTKFKLFKVHTLGDGTISNTKFKIEISNVRLAGTVSGTNWGTFTLSVRDFSDTDRRPKYLEIYQNLTMDPDSANYVARRVGDRYAYITFSGKMIEFGTYVNLSKYIRIEMTDVSYATSVIPYGFESYSTPVDSTVSVYLPPVRYSKASIYGLGPGKYPSGTVFGEVPAPDDEIAALYPTSSFGVGVNNDTLQWFKPLPYYGSADQNGLNIDFDLEDKVWGTATAKYYAQGVSASTGSLLDPSLSGSIPCVFDPVNESTYVKLRKFILGFQGGFDGQWPAIPINVGSDIIAGNTQGADCTTIKSPGSIAYKQALAALGNADEFDINMIVLPGIFREQHSYVTQLTIDMCETRGDCFYIMDNIVFPASNQSVGLVDAAVNSVADIDSNYVGTYYPWVKILDTNLNKIISVPPSVVMPAIYAANDNSAAEWYAPAGLNRGGIPQAVQVLDRLTHSERDTLYENRVNPIAAFPGQGIVVWGQKTLQIAPSALDRINVRRLLINLKKFVASSSKYLVFEQNTAATRSRFLNIVNPYLESVQQRSGIYAFKVKMDAENNTPDLIDRNILYGQIYIQPTRTAEFLIIDFNIMPSGGAVFNA